MANRDFYDNSIVYTAMGAAEYLFAPRKDHRGWSTPSEAARLFFIIAMVVSGWWSWQLAQGNIIVLPWAR